MTSKQRAYLRGLANTIPSKYQIGKNKVDYNFINLMREALEANELIKVTVLENSLSDVREICNEVCESVGAESVQIIGKKFVIYKESEKHKKIELPK